MAKILVLHGPNLNRLGHREVHLYGTQDLPSLNAALLQQATHYGHELLTLQSNAEHELIEAIQQTVEQHIHFIIFNPAAYTHTSIALRDALLSVGLPFIEVHLSNVAARESFRHHSYFSDIAVGTISGFGSQSYFLALEAADAYLKHHLSSHSL